MSPHRFLRSRVVAGTAAFLAATAIGGSTLTPPVPAFAADTAVNNVVLEVGASDSEVHLTWMSKLGHTTEQAVLAPSSEVKDGAFPADATTVEVEGELTANASNTYDADFTDLQPATEYTYRVGSDEHGWSEPATFTTNEASGDWNFLFFGDPQVGASGDVKKDTEGWQRALRTATKANPETDFILSAGDQVNDISQAQHDAFKSAPELRQFPLAVNNGNHDNLDFHMYRQNYSWPNVSDEVNEHNYFFTRGNALIVSLDSNLSGKAEIESHKNYVRQVVEAEGGDKDWVIVTYHHSPFSQAYHQADDDVKRLREELTPVFSELGVDAVLGGHDHIYTRSHLMEGTKPVVPEKKPAAGDVLRPEKGQVLYLIASSASGSKFYDFWADGKKFKGMSEEEAADKGLTAPFTARWNQDRTPDYTNVEVTDDTLTLTTYNVEDGSIVDQVTIDKTKDDAADNQPGADADAGKDNPETNKPAPQDSAAEDGEDAGDSSAPGLSSQLNGSAKLSGSARLSSEA